MPEEEGEKDEHHETIEEKDLLHNRVSIGLGTFQMYILGTVGSCQDISAGRQVVYQYQRQR